MLKEKSSGREKKKKPIADQETSNRVLGNQKQQSIKLEVCLLGSCEPKLKTENLNILTKIFLEKTVEFSNLVNLDNGCDCKQKVKI